MCDSTAVMKKGPPGRLCAVLSTEHLLLNGVRAQRDGMPLQLLIDCEYSCLTKADGYATMLIGVMSLDQKFHIVAYGVLNHEDETGQQHAMSATRRAVEATAGKYRDGNI